MRSVSIRENLENMVSSTLWISIIQSNIPLPLIFVTRCKAEVANLLTGIYLSRPTHAKF